VEASVLNHPEDPEYSKRVEQVSDWWQRFTPEGTQNLDEWATVAFQPDPGVLTTKYACDAAHWFEQDVHIVQVADFDCVASNESGSLADRFDQILATTVCVHRCGRLRPMAPCSPVKLTDSQVLEYPIELRSSYDVLPTVCALAVTDEER
jgi:hypothetical protein